MALIAAGVYFYKKRFGNESQHPKKGGRMQRVHSEDDEEGMIGEEDGDDEEEEDGDEDEEEEEEDDEDEDEEDGGEDEGEDEDEVPADLEGGGEPLTIKAFVALGDQIHSIELPLEGIDSWGALSQTIHEVCEEGELPDLPENGIMHMVLNINGNTMPVTGKTRIDELWRAKAIKVSITGAKDDAEDDGEEDEEDEEAR